MYKAASRVLVEERARWNALSYTLCFLAEIKCCVFCRFCSIDTTIVARLREADVRPICPDLGAEIKTHQDFVMVVCFDLVHSL